jgi:hypothetical protein
MKVVLWHFLRAHRIEVCLGVIALGMVGIVALLKRRFAAKADAWPTVTAKIENVFVDVLNQVPNRIPRTHAVLAYAYSGGDSVYSGEIRLRVGEAAVEILNKEFGRSVAADPVRPRETGDIHFSQTQIARLVSGERPPAFAGSMDR